MADEFSEFKVGLESPMNDAFDVTPNDGVDLTEVSRGLIVGVSGDVQIDTNEGTTIVMPALLAGFIHPIRAKRVYSTNTTATGIKAVV